MLTDLRFALRQLARTPGFTAVALVTLAVGIGSATVVFSAIHALLFKPLPLLASTQDRLLYVTETDRARGAEDLGWNYADFADLRRRSTALDGLWIHADRTVIIKDSNVPERHLGTEITWDAFALMGVNPIRGRGFVAADAELKAPNVALISEGLWKRRFGSDPAIIDTAVTLNSEPTTIIGVMPRGWRYPDLSDVWTPLRADPAKAPARGEFRFSGRARLRPGATLTQAQAEADAILGALAREFPASNAGIGVKLRPIREEAVEGFGQQTILLFGAVMFVFLIACLNVANLLLARAVTRAKELAIRLALGAERSRVIRQLVTESVVLGLLGGGGGLILGLWGNDAMVAAIPVDIPFWLRFDFDPWVFAFVLVLSLAGALIFGLVPALKVSRPDLVNELKEGGRSAETSGPSAHRLRNLLVIVEVALALVLLVGAGLMMRSYLQVQRQHPGFEARQVLTFRTGFPPAMFGDKKDIPARFFDDLLRRLAALPGVESVAATSMLPGRDGVIAGFVVEGEPRPVRSSDAPLAHHRLVTAGYFSTLRIPLRAGRSFIDAIDKSGSPRVAVVDEAFAVRHFGSPAAALGRRFSPYESEPGSKGGATATEAMPSGPMEIIGVVGTIRHRLDREQQQPTVYFPQSQDPLNFLSLVLRTRGDPLGLAEAARDTTLAVNRDIPIYDVFPLEQVVMRTDGVWQRKFFGYLFTVFGAVALFLACIGIYGVMSYNVTQRTQEIGVRMALGAQPAEVIRLVVGQGVRLVGYGLGAGFIAALALANLLAGVLYGVSPHDPPTFAAVPLLLAAVALVACWLPSHRATRIAPSAALRAE